MIQRIVTGWNLSRILFLAMGCYVMASSVMDRQWLGVALGAYFASMGLFSFGCAAGNCYSSSCNTNKQTDVAKINDVEFEEVKQK